MTRLAAVAALALAAGTLAACGGSDDSSGSGSGDSSTTSRGPITYVQGKDNSNVVRPLIDKWNKDPAHADEQVTFKEQSDQADQQHEDLVQHFQSKSTDYDVVDVDVVWTAEFAAQGWLAPLEGDLAIDTSPLLPATVASATYNGKLYAAPQTTDGGILYYRSDLVKTPPKSWDEMMSDCSIAQDNNIDCYAGQFFKYEGLTVNAAEAINGAGGTIVDESGAPTLDTDEAKAGLQSLVDGFTNGNIPAQAITYQEEQGRAAFEAGKLLFLRNWPYVYALATTDESSKVKDTLGMAPLVGVQSSGAGASSLGGHNAAISAYSEHKATAVDFLKYLETEETQKFFITQGSLAPVVSSLYDDAALAKQFPYLPVLKGSLDTAVPRPITPFYPAVTAAIQDNAYAALKGDKSVEDALKDMGDAISVANSGS